jgi:putative glutamine amidotransferase
MVKSTKGETRATVLYTTYSSMVRNAGGIPVILTPGRADEAPRVIERLDGLLMTGGGDIDPGRYGGELHETVYEVDALRDEYEIALALAARNQKLPTLAICRGMQVANVAFGGTLFEDIRSSDGTMLEHQIGGLGTIEPQHSVQVESGSAVAHALGAETLEVNSIHHQALREVAALFRTTGWAPDGTIEAIESDDPAWSMLGVQWHPEYLGEHDEPSVALFKAFVATATRSHEA